MKKKIRITEAQAEILANLPQKRKLVITTKQLNKIRESLGDNISKNFKKEFAGHKPKIQFEGAINEGGPTIELLELIRGVVDFILAELNNDTSHGLSPIFQQMGVTRGELFTLLTDMGLLGVTFYQLAYNEKIKAIRNGIKDIAKALMGKSETMKLGEAEKPQGITPQRLLQHLDLPNTRAEVDWDNRSELQIPSLTDGDANSIIMDKEFFTGRQFETRIGKKVVEDGYIKDFAKKFGEMPVFAINGNRIEVLNPVFKEWQQQYTQAKANTLKQWGTTETTGAASSGAFTGGMALGTSKDHNPDLDPSQQLANTGQDDMLTDAENPMQGLIGLPIGTEHDLFQVSSIDDKVMGKGGTVDYKVNLSQDNQGEGLVPAESHLIFKIDLANGKAHVLFNHDFEAMYDAEKIIPIVYHDNLNKIGNELYKQSKLNTESTTSGGMSAAGGSMEFDANAIDDGYIGKNLGDGMVQNVNVNEESIHGTVKIDDCTKLNNNKVAQNGGCGTGDDGVVSATPIKKSA